MAQTQTDIFGIEYATATGLGTKDIRIIIAEIVRIFLGFLGIIALTIVLYAGFLWLTSGGNEEKIAKAKKLLFNGVIGLVIILSAFAIVSFVISRLYEATTGGGGYQIPPYNNPNLPNGANFLVVIDKSPYPNTPAEGSYYAQLGKTDYPRNSQVVITFNRQLKADTVRLADNLPTDDPKHCSKPTVTIEKIDVEPAVKVKGAIKVVGNSLVFKPEAPVSADYESCNFKDCDWADCNCIKKYGNDQSCCGAFEPGTYKVTLQDGSGGIFSRDGKQLKKVSEDDFSFIIGDWIDKQKPKVISFAPTGGNNPRNTGVQVIFDKPIDPTTVLFKGECLDYDSSGKCIDDISLNEATVLIWKVGTDSDHNGSCDSGATCASSASDTNAVSGDVQRTTTSFIFRPTAICEAGCRCFDGDTAFQVDFKGDNASTGSPRIRDASCNALDCSASNNCEYNFGTGNYLDTTPPEIHIYTKAVDGNEDNFDFKSPVDPDDKTSIAADRLSQVYVSFCDKRESINDVGCPGQIDITTVNTDSWVVGNGLEGVLNDSLIDRQVNECCYLHYLPDGTQVQVYSPGCPYCDYDDTKTCLKEDGSKCPDNASLSSRLTPIGVLPPQERQAVTIYGGGRGAGSCTPADVAWGIKDLAGNGLFGNRDWVFTTSLYVNGGRPWITSIEPSAGRYEQCITIFGFNFGSIKKPGSSEQMILNDSGAIASAGKKVVIPHWQAYSTNVEPYCVDPEVDFNGDHQYEYPNGAGNYEGCYGQVFFRLKSDPINYSYPAEILAWGPINPAEPYNYNQIVAHVPEVALEKSGSYSIPTGNPKDFTDYINTTYDVTVELEP